MGVARGNTVEPQVNSFLLFDIMNFLFSFLSGVVGGGVSYRIERLDSRYSIVYTPEPTQLPHPCIMYNTARALCDKAGSTVGRKWKVWV